MFSFRVFRSDLYINGGQRRRTEAMYRQRPEKQSSLETEEHLFVNRLLHLPLVATAMDQMNSLYSTTKERNGLMKRTMERAETGVSAVLGTAAVPVIFMFDRPRELDDWGGVS